MPVVLWAHGTTGVARKCGPSVLPEPFTAGALFVLPQVIDRGWALVAPDYPGLGAPGRHPYLVGVPAARSALDAVRAARRLPGVRLSDETVVWGHSQGGGAALWVGEEGRAYAPDVPLAGVAALAPAGDVLGLARSLEKSPPGMLFASFVVRGYSDAYPDVRFGAYIRPAARTSVARVVGRCLSEPATLASLPVLAGQTLFARDLASGPLEARLRENVPDRPTGLPTLLAQGLDDTIVLPSVQRAFVAKLCAAGQPVDFRTYAGRDHVALVRADSPLIPELLRWTSRRFRGVSAPPGCSSSQG
jgi:alpha-beta hydrolase superfamily lysophospholipase